MPIWKILSVKSRVLTMIFKERFCYVDLFSFFFFTKMKCFISSREVRTVEHFPASLSGNLSKQAMTWKRVLQSFAMKSARTIANDKYTETPLCICTFSYCVAGIIIFVSKCSAKNINLKTNTPHHFHFNCWSRYKTQNLTL